MSTTGFGRTGRTRRPRASRVSCLLVATLIAFPIISATIAAAKTPGRTYCFHGVCHRVLTLAETRSRIGRKSSVIASYYSDCRVDRYNPCGLTSSGAVFRPSKADNAASPIYPNGTKLLVWNPYNHRAAVVRIDNAGPYLGNRTLDLSRAAADKLGFLHRGVSRLMVQVLSAPTWREARYRRRRVYPPVAGYIGRYDSMHTALAAVDGIPAARERALLASLVLPVRNTYLAERRLWLARMVGSGPVSVALAAKPQIRLPVQLVRAETPLRKPAASRTQRVAALTSKPHQQRHTRKQRSAKQERAPAKTRRRRNVQKSAQPKAAPKPATQAHQAAKHANALPQTAKPEAKPAETVIPRPSMRWRRSILGVNQGGA